MRDAAELRVKETDRIATIAENCRRMGIKIDVREDGFEIPGKQQLHAAELDSFGDHRIAMAFSVAALAADGPSTMEHAEAASVSFPEFYATLRRLCRGIVSATSKSTVCDATLLASGPPRCTICPPAP